MMLASRSILGALLCVTALHAQQTRVWPNGYQTQPGQGTMSAPFTITAGQVRNNARAMTLIHANSLPFGPGSVIEEMAFRRDVHDPQAFNALSGTLEVYIGTVPSVDDPIGNIHHMTREATRVFLGTLSIPGASRPSSGVAPFSLVIPFDRPWTYPGGDLMFELHWTDTWGTVWRRDAVELDDGVDPTVTPIGGHGQFGSHGYAPAQWAALEDSVPDGQLCFHLEGAPPERPVGSAVFYLGVARTQPLLMPAPDYIGGGEFWVDPILSEVMLTGDYAIDYARASIAVPLGGGTSLTGVEFAAQWLVLDQNQNVTYPVLASNALKIKIGARSTTSHIRYGRSLWAYGKGPSRSQALQPGPDNYVPITQFRGTFQ